MSENTEFTSDFNYLYKNEQKFFPVIQDSSLDSHPLDAANAVVIKLSAKVDDELIWEKERAYAQKVQEEGKCVLWELDFGVSQKALDSSDSSVFYSFGIAVDEFVNSLWREFKDISLGVILYRGDANFTKSFLWNEDHKTYFLEKLSGSESKKEIQEIIDLSTEEWFEALADNKLFKLFAVDVFSEYYQRLVSYLPDTVLAFCLLDVSEQTSNAFLAQMFSKARFQHLLLALKKSLIPIGHLNWEEGSCLGGWIGRGSPYFSTVSELSIAVCLPEDEYFTSSVYKALDVLFDELIEKQIPYRIIPENLLTEAWDGIDHIIVVSDAVSYQGKRRLQGFCAAGGTVVCIGEMLELSHVDSFEAFRSVLSIQDSLI